jgi:hypothetical protein
MSGDLNQRASQFPKEKDGCICYPKGIQFFKIAPSGQLLVDNPVNIR